jgi:hypothetical protein
MYDTTMAVDVIVLVLVLVGAVVVVSLLCTVLL